MRAQLSRLVLAAWFGGCVVAKAALTPEQAAQLPPAASHTVSFAKEIRPIFAEQCLSCHGPEKQKGGLRLDQRQMALDGGESGKVITPP